MKIDPMRRLAAADPVRTPPTVESAERLRCLIEHEQVPSSVDERQPGRTSRSATRRMFLGALLAAAICIALLVLDGGSSTPNVNVGAAAYAATAPRAGIVEAVFIARSHRGGALTTLRQQEWTDVDSQRQRELDTVEGPSSGIAAGQHAKLRQVTDWVMEPQQTEEWVARAPAIVTVRHIPAGVPFLQQVQQAIGIEHDISSGRERLAFEGISVDGLGSIRLFRSLYRLGAMHLVGRVRRGSTRLWKLESRLIHRPGGPSLSGDALTGDRNTRLIVLVDPRTFLPVAETQLDVSHPGRPRVLVEDRLIRYRHLPATAVNEKVFDLSAQHAGAHIVHSGVPLPRVTEVRTSGRGCPCYAIHGIEAHLRR